MDNPKERAKPLDALRAIEECRRTFIEGWGGENKDVLREELLRIHGEVFRLVWRDGTNEGFKEGFRYCKDTVLEILRAALTAPVRKKDGREEIGSERSRGPLGID